MDAKLIFGIACLVIVVISILRKVAKKNREKRDNNLMLLRKDVCHKTGLKEQYYFYDINGSQIIFDNDSAKFALITAKGNYTVFNFNQIMSVEGRSTWGKHKVWVKMLIENPHMPSFIFVFVNESSPDYVSDSTYNEAISLASQLEDQLKVSIRIGQREQTASAVINIQPSQVTATTELDKLAQLVKDGFLTKEEFDKEKQRVLQRSF